MMVTLPNANILLRVKNGLKNFAEDFFYLSLFFGSAKPFSQSLYNSSSLLRIFIPFARIFCLTEEAFAIN